MTKAVRSSSNEIIAAFVADREAWNDYLRHCREELDIDRQIGMPKEFPCLIVSRWENEPVYGFCLAHYFIYSADPVFREVMALSPPPPQMLLFPLRKVSRRPDQVVRKEQRAQA